MATLARDFFFHRRHGSINWQRISQLDLDAVVRNVDVDALQEFVEEITYADLGPADLTYVSSANFIQLFRLAQLIIEYLLNVQNYLLTQNSEHGETYKTIYNELDVAKRAFLEREDTIKALKREIRTQQRTIKSYEKSIANMGHGLRAQEGKNRRREAAEGSGNNDKRQYRMGMPDTGQRHPCKYCAAVFLSAEFLKAHVSRRHPNFEVTTKTLHQSDQESQTSPQTLHSLNTHSDNDSRQDADNVVADTLKKFMEEKNVQSNAVQQRLAVIEKMLTDLLKSQNTMQSAANDNQLSEPIFHSSESIKEQAYTTYEQVQSLQKEMRQQLTTSPVDYLTSAVSSSREESLAAMSRSSSLVVNPPLSSLSPDSRNQQESDMLSQRESDSLSQLESELSQKEIDKLPQKENVRLYQRERDGSPDQRGALYRVLAARDKKYPVFPDLPFLLARYEHSQQELEQRLFEFSNVVSQTDINDDELADMQQEINDKRLEPKVLGVENDLNMHVKNHFQYSQLVQQLADTIDDGQIESPMQLQQLSEPISSVSAVEGQIQTVKYTQPVQGNESKQMLKFDDSYKQSARRNSISTQSIVSAIVPPTRKPRAVLIDDSNDNDIQMLQHSNADFQRIDPIRSQFSPQFKNNVPYNGVFEDNHDITVNEDDLTETIQG